MLQTFKLLQAIACVFHCHKLTTNGLLLFCYCQLGKLRAKQLSAEFRRARNGDGNHRDVSSVFISSDGLINSGWNGNYCQMKLFTVSEIIYFRYYSSHELISYIFCILFLTQFLLFVYAHF